MKKFVCSILLLFLCEGLIQAQEKSDREKDNLIGNVSSVHIYMSGFSNIDGIWVEEEKQHTEQHCYDRDGKRSSVIQGYASSICTIPMPGVERKEEIRIDEKGFKVRTLSVDFHKSDFPLPPFKHVYTYNQQDNLLSYVVYEGTDAGRPKLLNSYNEKGDLAQAEYFDENGYLTTTQTFTYEYDAIGNWVKLIARRREPGEAQEVPFAVRYRTITYYKE
jgi:hypothetical protein